MRLRRRLLPEGGTPTDPCAPRVRAIEGTSDCIPLTPNPSPAEGRGEVEAEAGTPTAILPASEMANSEQPSECCNRQAIGVS